MRPWRGSGWGREGWLLLGAVTLLLLRVLGLFNWLAANWAKR